MPDKSLPEFAATFDRSQLQQWVQEAEQLRQRLRAKFPRESLATLPLESYAVGLGQGTLCYEYEYGTAGLGSIKGGSAGKFAVFFSTKKQAWQSELPGEADPQKAWDLLRAGLVQALDLAEQGRWEETDSVPGAQYVPALRVKMTHVFFPDEVLPIYALSLIQYFLSELGIDWKPQKGLYAATANRRLLAALRQIPMLQDWTTTELAQLLYQWSPPPKKGAFVSFEDFLEDFDRAKLQPQLQEAEQQRLGLIAKFPRDGLATLPMESYAAGVDLDEPTLCEMLARGTPALGVIKGAAFKRCLRKSQAVKFVEE